MSKGKTIRWLMLMMLMAFHSAVFAQQLFTLNGITFKKNTQDRLAQVVITNLHTKVMMMSDELGAFHIVASKGDTLEFSKTDYTPQSFAVVNANDAIIYMQPSVNLRQVDVKAQSTRTEINQTLKDYRSKGIYGSEEGYLPVWSFLNSPLTGLYQIFGKEPRDYRRFLASSRKELEGNEVNKRYTKELVMRITGLDDKGADSFMEIYRPSYEDIKEWNDYQLILYIKRNYAFYKKNRNPIKLSPLVTPKMDD